MFIFAVCSAQHATVWCSSKSSSIYGMRASKLNFENVIFSPFFFRRSLANFSSVYHQHHGRPRLLLSSIHQHPTLVSVMGSYVWPPVTLWLRAHSSRLVAHSSISSEYDNLFLREIPHSPTITNRFFFLFVFPNFIHCSFRVSWACIVWMTFVIRLQWPSMWFKLSISTRVCVCLSLLGCWHPHIHRKGVSPTHQPSTECPSFSLHCGRIAVVVVTVAASHEGEQNKPKSRRKLSNVLPPYKYRCTELTLINPVPCIY